MALRPIFLSQRDQRNRVTIRMVRFEWHPGLSNKQRQLSITSLHSAATAIGITSILEVSRKSTIDVGRRLSAFELTFTPETKECQITVENAFQGSKVFTHGGPFTDLFNVTPSEAKRDKRLRSSGHLIGFNFLGIEWPISPPTAFYDWIYINALAQHPDLLQSITMYHGFSDIEFNHLKSKNCQAHSVALALSLKMTNIDITSLRYQKDYQSTLYDYYQSDEYRKIIGWGQGSYSNKESEFDKYP